MAITNAQRQEYTKFAKNFIKPMLTKAWGVPIKVTTTASARPNPWIQVRVANYGQDIIPNSYRAKVARVMGFTDIRNPDDIHYGNISSNMIALQYDDWVKVLNDKSESMQEEISKEGSQWVVKSKSGRVLGKHDTKEKALAQLAAVHVGSESLTDELLCLLQDV